jgi:hypothetical protein
MKPSTSNTACWEVDQIFKLSLGTRQYGPFHYAGDEDELEMAVAARRLGLAEARSLRALKLTQGFLRSLKFFTELLT